jgi:hypothetical protein
MAILRDERDYSLPTIGRLLNRDHTAVMHGLKKYPDSVYTWHHPADDAAPLAVMGRMRMADMRAAAKARGTG